MKWKIIKEGNHYEIRDVFLFALYEPAIGSPNYYRTVEDAEKAINKIIMARQERKTKCPKPEIIKTIKYHKKSPN